MPVGGDHGRYFMNLKCVIYILEYCVSSSKERHCFLWIFLFFLFFIQCKLFVGHNLRALWGQNLKQIRRIKTRCGAPTFLPLILKVKFLKKKKVQPWQPFDIKTWNIQQGKVTSKQGACDLEMLTLTFLNQGQIKKKTCINLKTCSLERWIWREAQSPKKLTLILKKK